MAGRIGDGKPMGSKLSSPGGLEDGFTSNGKRNPRVKAPFDQTGLNSLMGKGKEPLPNAGTNRGAAKTAARLMSGQVGKPFAPSVGGVKGAKSPRGAAVGASKANSTVGPKSLGSMILKKNSVTGQSQTNMKPPKKEPRPTGVPVAKAINWHKKLGFDD